MMSDVCHDGVEDDCLVIAKIQHMFLQFNSEANFESPFIRFFE
jgi:hypothetical protein